MVGELFTNTCISCIKITNTKHEKFPESQIIFAGLIIIYWIHRKWGDLLTPSLKPSSDGVHWDLECTITENNNFNLFIISLSSYKSLFYVEAGMGIGSWQLYRSFSNLSGAPCVQLTASQQWRDFDIKNITCCRGKGVTTGMSLCIYAMNWSHEWLAFSWKPWNFVSSTWTQHNSVYISGKT